MIQEILFKNDTGVIYISGGTNPLLDLTSISGLTLPEKEVNLATFKNIAGQKLISSRDKSRTIKIEGLLKGNLAAASHILYSNGTIIIRNELINRVIDARCTHISDRNTEGKISMIFMCDNPYFHDDADMTMPVYSRIKLVSSPFALPCVFTRRIREGNLKNQSSVPAEPEICIQNKGKTVLSGFILKNESTGATLSAEKEILPNEKILISIKNRTMLSGDNENLLPFLSETSYLHDFVLAPGENLIKLTAEDGLECEITYNTNYTEAVI